MFFAFLMKLGSMPGPIPINPWSVCTSVTEKPPILMGSPPALPAPTRRGTMPMSLMRRMLISRTSVIFSRAACAYFGSRIGAMVSVANPGSVLKKSRLSMLLACGRLRGQTQARVTQLDLLAVRQGHPVDQDALRGSPRHLWGVSKQRHLGARGQCLFGNTVPGQAGDALPQDGYVLRRHRALRDVQEHGRMGVDERHPRDHAGYRHLLLGLPESRNRVMGLHRGCPHDEHSGKPDDQHTGA